VPDCNGCEAGSEFWIENKQTNGWKFGYGSEQIGWTERRLRAGGRVFLAVRRQTTAGPRKGAAVDQLWFTTGDQFRFAALGGLEAARWLVKADGGPENWPWEEIRHLLVEFDFLSLTRREITGSGHSSGETQ
jgi:hypothetical protein